MIDELMGKYWGCYQRRWVDGELRGAVMVVTITADDVDFFNWG